MNKIIKKYNFFNMQIEAGNLGPGYYFISTSPDTTPSDICAGWAHTEFSPVESAILYYNINPDLNYNFIINALQSINLMTEKFAKYQNINPASLPPKIKKYIELALNTPFLYAIETQNFKVTKLFVNEYKTFGLFNFTLSNGKSGTALFQIVEDFQNINDVKYFLNLADRPDYNFVLSVFSQKKPYLSILKSYYSPYNILYYASLNSNSKIYKLAKKYSAAEASSFLHLERFVKIS